MQQELSKVLLHAGLKLPEKELQSVFRLLDQGGNGKVSYTEFCNVVEEKTVPDYRAFVLKERERQAKETAEKRLSSAKAANIRSLAGDVGSSQVSRDDKLGKVEGLSSIMEKSAIEGKEQPQLLDDGDYLRVQADIKELLRVNKSGKPTTFDDLL